MDQEINVIGTINAIYTTLKKIRVSGDEDVIAMGDCFRALYAVSQRLAEEQQRIAEEKKSEGSEAPTPPHKRES